MARSVLGEPPKGSELGARFAALLGGQPFCEALIALGEAKSDDLLVEEGERQAVLRDPRIWKHPAQRIARHVVPQHLTEEFGEATAADILRHPDFVLGYAQRLQTLEYYRATAAQRAKEPRKGHELLVAALILAEFLNVQERAPDRSLNYCFRTTGRNLGRAGQPIGRSIIRRSVSRILLHIGRESERGQEMMTLSVFRLRETFRTGWETRLHEEGLVALIGRPAD